MRILPSGDAALLVEAPDPRALYAALAASPPPGVADVVPAARTLTLLLAPSADPVAVAA
ncbi:carboxyltransferase domain-containing protein, partial [Actinomadura bangladeshensis]|nr:carboxyltransferase domain-containing protein [Actinomadura bangladeshensis]